MACSVFWLTHAWSKRWRSEHSCTIPDPDHASPHRCTCGAQKKQAKRRKKK